MAACTQHHLSAFFSKSLSPAHWSGPSRIRCAGSRHLAALGKAEHKRLARRVRKRDIGGGPHLELSTTNQLLLTVIWYGAIPPSRCSAFSLASTIQQPGATSDGCYPCSKNRDARPCVGGRQRGGAPHYHRTKPPARTCRMSPDSNTYRVVSTFNSLLRRVGGWRGIATLPRIVSGHTGR
jgi:hypothetical protein